MELLFEVIPVSDTLILNRFISILICSCKRYILQLLGCRSVLVIVFFSGVEGRKRGSKCITMFDLINEKTVLNFENLSYFMIFTDMFYNMLKSVLALFLLFLDFSSPKVVPHIAGEIERANNMQFLRYLSSHDYEFYWECLWCDLLLILFGKFAHLKTCSLSKSSKYFTEWIGISLLPSILILKLWSKFAFFDLNSTSSVFLILRLNLLAFRN